MEVQPGHSKVLIAGFLRFVLDGCLLAMKKRDVHGGLAVSNSVLLAGARKLARRTKMHSGSYTNCVARPLLSTTAHEQREILVKDARQFVQLPWDEACSATVSTQLDGRNINPETDSARLLPSAANQLKLMPACAAQSNGLFARPSPESSDATSTPKKSSGMTIFIQGKLLKEPHSFFGKG
jgi:hypothetical protein